MVRKIRRNLDVAPLQEQVASVLVTGEIVERDPAKRKRMSVRGSETRALHYVMLDDRFVVEVLPQLGPTQTRIVMEILRGYREGEPWARFTAAELHNGILGIGSSNFYRALAPLREANIVWRPSRTTWQVNPRVGWRGARREWSLALRDAEPIGEIVQQRRKGEGL